MGKPAHGATIGDFGISVEQFAEHHPWRFLLTVPVTLALALLIAALGLKIVVLGPLTTHKANYDRTRENARRSKEAKLL